MGSNSPETSEAFGAAAERRGRLEGKVAIITGAARGTGEVTARAFAAEGATVWVVDLNDKLGEQVAEDIGDQARFHHLDITDEGQWARVVEQVVSLDGQIDILVNNAGILHLKELGKTTANDFRRLFEVNVIGAALGIQAVTETMKAQGEGSIVNISSVDGVYPKNGVSAYAASKHALRGMAKVAAMELGHHNIRVNNVCPEAGGPEMVRPEMPGGIDPELVMGSAAVWRVLPQQDRSMTDRMGDIADMVLSVAVNRSMTGADVMVDGGHSAGHVFAGSPGAPPPPGV